MVGFAVLLRKAAATVELSVISNSNFPAFASTGVQNGCFLNSGSIRVSVHVDTNGNIKAFDTSGSNTATVDIPGTYLAGVCLSSSRMLTLGSTNIEVVEATSNSAFTVLSSYSYTPSSSFESRFALAELSSTLVYFSSQTSAFSIKKYDWTAVSLASVFTSASNPSMALDALLMMSNTLYAMGTVNKIIVIDKTTMTQVTAILISRAVSTAIADDTTSNNFFYTDYDGSGNYHLIRAAVSGGTISTGATTSLSDKATNLVSIPSSNLLL